MAQDEGTFQMLWKCEYCETDKLLALDHKHCPVCGAAQNPERRYYPEEGDEVAVADHQYAGADKVCPACEAPNSALAKFCGTCGSDLEGAKDSKTRDEQRAADGESFDQDSAKAAKSEHAENKKASEAARRAAIAGEAPTSTEASAPQGKGGLLGALGGLVILGGILIGFVVLCMGIGWLMSKEVGVVAQGHSWERTIDVEEYQTRRASDWKKDVPSAARNLSCKKEKSGTKQVEDGETCETVRKDQGDGTFKKSKECKPKYKDVPVFGDKCSYDIDSWGVVRTETAQGSGKEGRSWPKTNLKQTGQCLGCQREGARKETLKLSFSEAESGEAYKAECESESDWLAVEVGQLYEAKGSLGSSYVNCASLKKK